jgi:hypothetical protein
MENSVEALQKIFKKLLSVLPVLVAGINPKECELRYKKAPVHPSFCSIYSQ